MREDEVLSFKARHGVNTADHSIKTVRVLPFLIIAKTIMLMQVIINLY